MTLLELLQSSPVLLYCLTALLGLLVGSFLNVVIYRLPLMMQRDWRQQCCEYLQVDSAHVPGGAVVADPLDPLDPLAPAPAPPVPDLPVPEHQTFNLLKPDSHCPTCQSKVRPWQNIPVLSYLLLRGRCAHCRTPIHWRYPTVELVTAVLSALVAWKFGATPACLAALVLVWALIALAVIDIDHQLLPDSITLPLLWLGLLLTLTPWGLGVSTSSALIGAAAGYLSLWSLYWIFRLLTGREGMGYGDFKLLAALGAWLGWPHLLPIVILSSLSGAIVGLAMMSFAGRDRHTPMSFGPYLALAGIVSLLWGDAIQAWYLTTLGGSSL